MPDGSKELYNEKGKLIRTLVRGESLNISNRDQAKLTFSDPERVKVVKRIFYMYVEQGRGGQISLHTMQWQVIGVFAGKYMS